MLKLASGEYLGKPLRRRCLYGLSLTVSTYSPRCAYPWHVHELPGLFILLAGQQVFVSRAFHSLLLQLQEVPFVPDA